MDGVLHSDPRRKVDPRFTGTVRIERRAAAFSPERSLGTRATFKAGARTAWHTNPLGQTLIVKAGNGRLQRWGKPIEILASGDVFWVPAREKHWHGASPSEDVVLFTIQAPLSDRVVDWLEEVTHDQYLGR